MSDLSQMACGKHAMKQNGKEAKQQKQGEKTTETQKHLPCKAILLLFVEIGYLLSSTNDGVQLLLGDCTVALRQQAFLNH